MKRLLLAAALFSFTSFHGVYASETDNVESYKKELIALNKNIGTYYFAQDSLKKPIENLEHQQIGTVQDFLINNQGEVQTLIAELNAMDLNGTPLTLAYNDISQNSDAYQIALNAENMEAELAGFLANIEVAAGASAEDLVSTRRLHGRDIVLPNGESIGQVENVITNKNNDHVVGVLVKGFSTRPEYERIALPYPNGLKIKNTGFSNNLQLFEDYVEIIAQYSAEGIPH